MLGVVVFGSKFMIRIFGIHCSPESESTAGLFRLPFVEGGDGDDIFRGISRILDYSDNGYKLFSPSSGAKKGKENDVNLVLGRCDADCESTKP